MKKSSAEKAEWLEVFDSDSDFEWVEPQKSEVARNKTTSLPSGEKNKENKDEKKSSSVQIVMPEYIIEVAKSGRAECKKCNSKIAKDEVRVGVQIQGSRWLTTNWQHLQCTVFPSCVQVAEALNGFCSLPARKQSLVQERVTSSMQEVDPDMLPVDPNELVRTTWSVEMEPVNELLMPLLPYQKEVITSHILYHVLCFILSLIFTYFHFFLSLLHVLVFLSVYTYSLTVSTFSSYTLFVIFSFKHVFLL
jgi:hypothetical protein